MAQFTAMRWGAALLGLALSALSAAAPRAVAAPVVTTEAAPAATSTTNAAPTAAAAERTLPAPVLEARRKFQIVDQQVSYQDVPAAATAAATADEGVAGSAAADGVVDGISAAPEGAVTAAVGGGLSATSPAGTRAAALARNAAASAAYAGRTAGQLRGIKLIAAPYLNSEAHSSLTRGAEDKLAALGGRTVTAALLQRALSEVTRYYRDQGFLGAQAYFPVQTASDGVLALVVATPVLTGVSAENKSGVRDSYLDYLLGGVEEQVSLPIEHEELNNQLLKLTDLGIFSLRGEFSATDAHGLSHDLDLVAEPQRSGFEFSLFADNEGTESSGRYRFGALADFINVTGSADRLALFYARSNEQQNNYSLTYELPINSHPTVLGLDFCYSNYELSQAYEVLGAQGHEYSAELYVKEPIYRTASAKSIWRSGLRYRDLTDEFRAFDLEFQKHSLTGYTELSGYKAYLADHTIFSYRGRLSYGALYCDDEYELTEERNYLMAQLDLGFNQWWNDALSYSAQLQLQLTNTPLDSSEQMQAGGSRGLRAYASSALVGDSGVIWSNALNIRLYTNERSTKGTADSTRSYDSYEALTLSPHIEYAKVYDRTSTLGNDSGTSCGLTLAYSGHGLNAELDFSHGIGKRPTYADKEGRISFSLSYTF